VEFETSPRILEESEGYQAFPEGIGWCKIPEEITMQRSESFSNAYSKITTVKQNSSLKSPNTSSNTSFASMCITYSCSNSGP
jgi:hypothetical protein